MKKVLISGIILFFGISIRTYASVGIANDGVEFTFALVGCLLVLAIALQGIDYLRKNGRRIIHTMAGRLKMNLRHLVER